MCIMPEEVQAFGWLLVILALLVFLFIVFSFVRKYFKSASVDTPAEAFTLADVRDLFKQGKITQTEFEQLKQHVIAMTQAESAKASDSTNPKPPAV